MPPIADLIPDGTKKFFPAGRIDNRKYFFVPGRRVDSLRCKKVLFLIIGKHISVFRPQGSGFEPPGRPEAGRDFGSNSGLNAYKPNGYATLSMIPAPPPSLD